jgi:hypothetical protein
VVYVPSTSTWGKIQSNMSQCALISSFCKRQQRDIAGAFNRLSHLALMLGAVPRYPPRGDLAAVSCKTSKHINVFVIYGFDFTGAKSAHLSTRSSGGWSSHYYVLLLILYMIEFSKRQPILSGLAGYLVSA